MQQSTEADKAMKEFFEELEPGRSFQTGGMTVTEEAIIRFGLEWDFQPFHVDKVAAQSSIFGGLIASGLHTILITFRLCVQADIFTGNAVAGLGFKEIRFPNAVHPGSTLRVIATVRRCRPSGTKPGFGVVEWDLQCRDDAGRVVVTMLLSNLVRCRDTALRHPLPGPKER
jgi:acyl dehydratase